MKRFWNLKQSASLLTGSFVLPTFTKIYPLIHLLKLSRFEISSNKLQQKISTAIDEFWIVSMFKNYFSNYFLLIIQTPLLTLIPLDIFQFWFFFQQSSKNSEIIRNPKIKKIAWLHWLKMSKALFPGSISSSNDTFTKCILKELRYKVAHFAWDEKQNVQLKQLLHEQLHNPSQIE